MKIRVCVLQFTSDTTYKKTLERVKAILEQAEIPDFALIGGEFSTGESKNTDPYPALIDLATSFKCNIVAPINANLNRFPNLKQKGFSSMHIFNRKGEVVAIQDKQHFYWKERPWFRPGKEIKIFEVDNIKIGLIRGLDILYPTYTQRLKEAEILFCSTMAVDDMMFELAKTRALENQSYVVMSSFIGIYVRMLFVGNAVILKPTITIRTGMKMTEQTKILQHTTKEGFIQAELDIEYIRKIKKDYPMGEL
ncbi:MAG: carbon-nitrogen hydrolase family protein [Candidatus Helarchaeota archaeon]|nr:carbon-nitrogen hydrolase family protein [Candidatus Helarchaeota archaeon]